MLALIAVLALQLAGPADAEPLWSWERLALDSGHELEIAVQLPPDGLGDEPVPVLLALPPGEQDRAMVERGFELYWSAAAAERGWVLVSPAAPTPEGFHGDGLRDLELLLDVLDERFDIAGGRVHLAGVSNGGRSAFALALRDPERIGSLTGAPGMPEPDADPAQVAVSFAELFDAALLAPPGVVPLEARLAAGDPSFRPPRTPARMRSESSTLTAAPLDAWLAGAAAFLGLVGLALLRV